MDSIIIILIILILLFLTSRNNHKLFRFIRGILKLLLITLFINRTGLSIELSLVGSVLILISGDIFFGRREYFTNSEKEIQAQVTSNVSTTNSITGGKLVNGSIVSDNMAGSPDSINAAIANALQSAKSAIADATSSLKNSNNNFNNTTSTDVKNITTSDLTTTNISNLLPQNKSALELSSAINNIGQNAMQSVGLISTVTPDMATSNINTYSLSQLPSKNTSTGNVTNNSTIICQPDMPKFEIKSNYKATLVGAIASSDNKGVCKTSKSIDVFNFNKKIIVGKNNALKLIGKVNPGNFKTYHLMVLKGYKMIVTNDKGNKTTFAATSNNNGMYNDNYQIIKAFENVIAIDINPL